MALAKVRKPLARVFTLDNAYNLCLKITIFMVRALYRRAGNEPPRPSSCAGWGAFV